jgi:hypothetical protein
MDLLTGYVQLGGSAHDRADIRQRGHALVGSRQPLFFQHTIYI